MASCSNPTSLAPLRSLELPEEFEDLEGLLQADLRAVVAMLSQRADERLMLTRREHNKLQRDLWNRLAEALRTTMAPLSAESR